MTEKEKLRLLGVEGPVELEAPDAQPDAQPAEDPATLAMTEIEKLRLLGVEGPMELEAQLSTPPSDRLQAKRHLESGEKPEAKSRRVSDSPPPKTTPEDIRKAAQQAFRNQETQQEIKKLAKKIDDRWSSTVFVGIKSDVRAAVVSSFFEANIGYCHVTSRPDGWCGGFAFVTFRSPDAAKECLRWYGLNEGGSAPWFSTEVKCHMPTFRVDSMGTQCSESKLSEIFSPYGMVTIETKEGTRTLKFRSLQDKAGLAQVLAAQQICDLDGRIAKIVERGLPTHILTWFEPCRYWNGPSGCWNGSSCRFAHWAAPA
jgi:hypothetical protein